jgi:ABC-2 type transport system ATP-binding protein
MIELTSLHRVTNQGVKLDIPAFRVEAGEIVALVGSTGSGWEMVFELLCGKAITEQGQVRIAGVDPGKDHVGFTQKVGVLFTEDGLYKNLTAEENLLFECRLRQIPKSRNIETLALLGLSEQQHTRINQLSACQQRRLAFARAILHSPAVLLLIEPFLRCDEASIQIISEVLRKVALAGAAVLIFASESSRLVNLCDVVYVIQQGHLEEIGKPSAADTSGRPFKIPVKLEDRVALVNPSEILYAEASGDTALIQTLTERLPTQFTLSELEERLKRSGFFRAHRAYLVNLQHVREVIPFTRNSYSLRLDDPNGTILPLSKAAASELKELLDF